MCGARGGCFPEADLLQNGTELRLSNTRRAGEAELFKLSSSKQPQPIQTLKTARHGAPPLQRAAGARDGHRPLAARGRPARTRARGPGARRATRRRLKHGKGADFRPARSRTSGRAGRAKGGERGGASGGAGAIDRAQGARASGKGARSRRGSRPRRQPQRAALPCRLNCGYNGCNGATMAMLATMQGSRASAPACAAAAKRVGPHVGLVRRRTLPRTGMGRGKQAGVSIRPPRPPVCFLPRARARR